jgi:hypothetical protein
LLLFSETKWTADARVGLISLVGLKIGPSDRDATVSISIWLKVSNHWEAAKRKAIKNVALTDSDVRDRRNFQQFCHIFINFWRNQSSFFGIQNMIAESKIAKKNFARVRQICGMRARKRINQQSMDEFR